MNLKNNNHRRQWAYMGLESIIMHVSYGLKCALFGVTGCMFKSGRSVKSVKVVRVGRSSRSSRFGSVNLRRLVPSDVELSLRPSSYVGLSWLALAADNAYLGLY